MQSFEPTTDLYGLFHCPPERTTTINESLTNLGNQLAALRQQSYATTVDVADAIPIAILDRQQSMARSVNIRLELVGSIGDLYSLILFAIFLMVFATWRARRDSRYRLAEAANQTNMLESSQGQLLKFATDVSSPAGPAKVTVGAHVNLEAFHEISSGSFEQSLLKQGMWKKCVRKFERLAGLVGPIPCNEEIITAIDLLGPLFTLMTFHSTDIPLTRYSIGKTTKSDWIHVVVTSIFFTISTVFLALLFYSLADQTQDFSNTLWWMVEQEMVYVSSQCCQQYSPSLQPSSQCWSSEKHGEDLCKIGQSNDAKTAANHRFQNLQFVCLLKNRQFATIFVAAFISISISWLLLADAAFFSSYRALRKNMFLRRIAQFASYSHDSMKRIVRSAIRELSIFICIYFITSLFLTYSMMVRVAQNASQAHGNAFNHHTPAAVSIIIFPIGWTFLTLPVSLTGTYIRILERMISTRFDAWVRLLSLTSSVSALSDSSRNWKQSFEAEIEEMKSLCFIMHDDDILDPKLSSEAKCSLLWKSWKLLSKDLKDCLECFRGLLMWLFGVLLFILPLMIVAAQPLILQTFEGSQTAGWFFAIFATQFLLLLMVCFRPLLNLALVDRSVSNAVKTSGEITEKMHSHRSESSLGDVQHYATLHTWITHHKPVLKIFGTEISIKFFLNAGYLVAVFSVWIWSHNSVNS